MRVPLDTLDSHTDSQHPTFNGRRSPNAVIKKIKLSQSQKPDLTFQIALDSEPLIVGTIPLANSFPTSIPTCSHSFHAVAPAVRLQRPVDFGDVSIENDLANPAHLSGQRVSLPQLSPVPRPTLRAAPNGSSTPLRRFERGCAALVDDPLDRRRSRAPSW